MNHRALISVISLLLLSGGQASFSATSLEDSPGPLQGAGCDRECLKGFITQYIEAMLAGKPESLPLDPKVRFTEDCNELKLGEGLWKGISRFRDYRRDIIDVREGSAVSYLVAEEGTSPVLYAVRLKIVDKKIAEIETVAVRGQKEGMLFNPQNLQTVTKMMAYKPTEAEKNTREEMIKIALTYPEGLKVGSFVKVDSPMVDDAYRFENGQLMAGPGCTFFPDCENMKKQRIPRLSGITHRIIAVDEDLGVVAMRMNFGPGSTFEGNGVLDVWHSFKIFGGKMHAAEAYCEIVPLGKKSGWD